MTWHFNFRNNGDVAFFGVSDNFFDFLLGVKSAITNVVKSLVGVMSNHGTVSPSSYFS
jgi:hypothetical protein